MLDLSRLFNDYNRKARLYPGLVALLPIMALSVALLRERLAWCIPLVSYIGGQFLLVNYVRGQGQRAQRTLVRTWKGLPTTYFLRWRTDGVNPISRARWHEKLASFTGVPLPTAEDEHADPLLADHRYEVAVRAFVVHVRDDTEHFPRVNDENIWYGYRRNLYGIKMLALIVITISICLVGAIMVLRGPQLETTVVAAIDVALSAFWLLVVRPAWVQQSAETYAELLFEALDNF